MLKIIFFGTPQFAVPSLERLLKHPEFEVVAVVTQPDKPRGRGKKLIPSAVKKVAVEHQLEVWQPSRIKKDAIALEKLRNSQADAFVVVAYGQILSLEILKMPRLGCINGHGSLLPQYRGAAPIQWCLYHGETVTGMTIMLMDEGMDTGAMLLKSQTPIGLLDNAHQLAETLSQDCAELLVETLLKLQQQNLEAIPQDDAQATYAPLIKKSDYRLDWSREAIALHHQVRGFFPNCFTTFREQNLKILATIPLGEEYWSQLPSEFDRLATQCQDLSSLSGEPGEVLRLVKKFGPILQTGQGLLLLHQVQLPGKRPQSAWDFVNGTRLAVGEKLDTSAH